MADASEQLGGGASAGRQQQELGGQQRGSRCLVMRPAPGLGVRAGDSRAVGWLPPVVISSWPQARQAGKCPLGAQRQSNSPDPGPQVRFVRSWEL